MITINKNTLISGNSPQSQGYILLDLGDGSCLDLGDGSILALNTFTASLIEMDKRFISNANKATTITGDINQRIAIDVRC